MVAVESLVKGVPMGWQVEQTNEERLKGRVGISYGDLSLHQEIVAPGCGLRVGGGASAGRLLQDSG